MHHADAVGPEVDPRRPLSPRGERQAAEIAAAAAANGARPEVVWHSGKLRAKQTAEACWRACNALAAFSATRDLQPHDPPRWMRDRLRGETRDLLIAGHFPHLPGLLAALLDRGDAGADPGGGFPLHGLVALETLDEGDTWSELWQVETAI